MSKSLADQINETKHGGEKVASRGTTTWTDPEDLYIITDPNDKNYAEFYDDRVEWPLSEEVITSLVLNKQISAVKVWKDGTNIVVIAGKRRTLHIREINRRYAKGLDLDRETMQWVKAKAPSTPMQVRCEQIEPGLEVGEIQRLILAENTNEPETTESLARKLQRFAKHSTPAQLRASCGGMGQRRFDNLMAYMDLSAAGKQAVKEGRLHLDNIKDIASIPKAEQAEAIAKIPVEATKVDDIREALDNVKEGKAPTEPRERKRAWGRRDIATFRETIIEVCRENSRERTLALALMDLFDGNVRKFKAAGFDDLIKAWEAMDKANEKRRRKRREKEKGK